MRTRNLSFNKTLAAFSILFAIIFIIYGNTFHASWHMDDYHNIVDNPRLHLTKMSPRAVAQTFHASYDGGKYQSEKLYRPVACLSFALNWYLGGSNVFGYHLLNILIHWLTAFFLYLVIRMLLRAPGIGRKYQGNEFIIALFSAALWAAAPIQTQAVTYIVQRMASLAAMFYLLGLFCYLKGRTDLRPNFRWLYYVLCFTCFLLALGSKENAITMPLALLLTEIVFFHRPGTFARRKALHYVLAIGIVAIVILFFFFRADIPAILSYKIRNFTLTERLLTEPRILLFYLWQIFFPRIQDLSITHDVMVSHSLWAPWTTLPSIMAVLGLIFGGFFLLRRRPLVSFGVLFFFLAHLIESTIIPLELIFEHRNYLPSAFIYLPLIAGLIRTGENLRRRSGAAPQLINIALVLIIIVFGCTTWMRNVAWCTEKSLWKDVLLKAPFSERPYYNLAWGYYMRVGEFPTAIKLFKKALSFTDPERKDRLAETYLNMGNCYYLMRDYENAIMLYEKALDAQPKHQKALHNLAITLAVQGRWKNASKNMDLLLTIDSRREEYLNFKSLILLKLGKADEAISYSNNVLRKNRKSYNALLNLGVALNLTGKYEEAENVLSMVNRLYPDHLIPYFALLENSLMTADLQKTERLMEKMESMFGEKMIKTKLRKLRENNLQVPIAAELIDRAIAERINWKKQGDENGVQH